MTIRTLHIDIEGGWGGSSRSLYELVCLLDRSKVSPYIVYRQDGPIAARYQDVGMPAKKVPGIFSFVPRRVKSARILLATLPRLLSLPAALVQMSTVVQEHKPDVVHLNYEGLAFMGLILRKKFGIPIICHSRTGIPDNRWGRFLIKQIKACSDYVLFISDQEEANFRRLEVGQPHPGEVIWNVAAVQPRVSLDSPPEAVCIANIDWMKGTDRLIDIAAALDELKAPPLTIAVYGKARSGSAYEQEIRSRAANYPHRLVFRGFIENPESVIAKSLALLRPSRRNNPWGRDVIEASVCGTPVLATGNYQGVVLDGVTGHLFDEFDAKAFADRLIQLATDEAYWKTMSQNALSRAERFDGTFQKKRFTEIVESISKRQPVRRPEESNIAMKISSVPVPGHER